MASVSIEIDARQLKGFLKNLEDGAGQFVKITTEVMRNAMRLGEQYAKQNVTNQMLSPRTGRLRASIKGEVEIGGEADDGAGTITGRLGILKPRDGSVPIYGAAQEFGAEARPVNAKVMTIPLKAALTAAGVTRFTANEARRLFDRTFWWKDILYGATTLRRGKRQRTRTSASGAIRARGTPREKIVPLFYAATYVKIGGGPGVGRRYLQDARNRLVAPLNKALGVRIADLLRLRKEHGN